MEYIYSSTLEDDISRIIRYHYPVLMKSEIPTNKLNQRYGRTSLLSRSAIAASPK